jgi:NADPH2 dehydrogenase
MLTFQEYSIKNMTLRNRIVMPPMCMYSSDDSGKVKDFHFVHYVDRAIGGAGLIIMEATAVVPNGRISQKDLGLWSNGHFVGLKRIVDVCHEHGAKIAIQLAHAGRKSGVKNEDIVAPSPIRFDETYPVPKELTVEDIVEITAKFREAALRAHNIGFDAIEIHAAHGYLIHEFLSPVTNKRTDNYGGTLENRIRFLKEILKEIKVVWPREKPIILRVSASDYMEHGITLEEMIKIVNLIKDDIDVIHVSSGGIQTVPINAYPGYQVQFSEAIKKLCQIPTIAVGLIEKLEQTEEILNSNRADLVALGRELLRSPYWVLDNAVEWGIDYKWPVQYERALKIRKPKL